MRKIALLLMLMCAVASIAISAENTPEGSNIQDSNYLLNNMKARMKALQEIDEYINKGEFDKASELSEKLLPFPMVITSNEKFREAIAEFQKQFREFTDTLQQGNITESSQALAILGQKCMNCHEQQGLHGREGLQKLEELLTRP